MASLQTVYLRLPRHIFLALIERAESRGDTLAGTVRNILNQGVDDIDLSTPYEKPDRVSASFKATQEFKDKSEMAAMMQGVSINTLYTSLLAEELGVLPCVVVAENGEDIR